MLPTAEQNTENNASAKKVYYLYENIRTIHNNFTMSYRTETESVVIIDIIIIIMTSVGVGY
jgi:hypothetical protein